MQGLDTKKRGDALVITCRGDITFENTAEIRQYVESQLSEAEYKALVLDLAEVAFMDSSGIGTLVALNSKVYSSGRKLYLMAPAEPVLKTLELVKLSSFFDFIGDPEELDLLSC